MLTQLIWDPQRCWRNLNFLNRLDNNYLAHEGRRLRRCRAAVSAARGSSDGNGIILGGRLSSVALAFGRGLLRRCHVVDGRCHGVGGLVAKEHDNQLLRISVPSGDHSLGDLALSPVHA